MNTLFHGVLMLATCAGCYLLWWGVAFYPERHAPLWLSGILLVATAVCGIMAVNWMSQGIFQTEGIRKGVSGGWIMAGTAEISYASINPLLFRSPLLT